MPKRKRKKVGWMTTTIPKHGMMRNVLMPSLMAKDPMRIPNAPTIGAMYSGLSRLQNPMHPVHPAWGHMQRLYYTIWYI